MTDIPTKKRLGRGLAALLGDEITHANPTEHSAHPYPTDQQSRNHTITMLPIERIIPSKHNPRRHIDPEKLHELAQSIRAKGLLQPILVRPDQNRQDNPEHYEIIAGERRWHAAQIAQRHHVPVIIRNFSDMEITQIALIENIQRQDINPLDEGDAYHRLIEEFHYTQQELSEMIGKSRSHIANMMRLIKLPESVKDLMRRAILSTGHARALIGVDNAHQIANRIIREKLSVHAVEELVRRQQNAVKPTQKQALKQKNTDIAAFEQQLEEKLGMRIAITYSEQRKTGKITVHFHGIHQFEDLCEKLLR